MPKNKVDQAPDTPSDDRLAALHAAAEQHEMPIALLASAVQSAEAASRHRLRAVSASRIDGLVTDLVQARRGLSTLDVS